MSSPGCAAGAGRRSMARLPNPAWGLYVLIAGYLFYYGSAQTASSGFDANGFSQDLSALLAVKKAIPNWNLYQQRSTCFGWHETPFDNVCQWTSVKCRNGVVVALQLQTNASFHLGRIEDVMKAASGLPNLEVLDLAGQAFSGTLPAQYSFPNLLSLDLMDNDIKGTIPAAWGTNAMFPKLANLSLAYNSPLSGTLPASWGADNSSLTGLQLFQANNCNLTGPLPANWSTYLPALKDINISSNGLTGSLPPQWSSLDLNTLNLDRNALTGTIPGRWGSGGSFLHLKRLSLFANKLTGFLPSTWTRNQFATGVQPVLPQLQWLDVANNMLSGKVPDFGDPNNPPYLISNGNDFCGSPPPSPSVWDCASTCTKFFKWPACSANGTSPAVAPPAPALTTSNISQAISPDMAVLLTLQTAFSNWDIFQRTQQLNWTSPGAMCTGWQAVQCNNAGAVIGLNFSSPDPDPPQRPRALEGVTNYTVHSSQPISLQGNLSEVLRIASKLPRLALLDFRNQYLTGSIPNNLSFPSLQGLFLRNNGIQGTLPGDWAGGQAMPMLQDLDLSKNYQVSGTLPDAWGNATGAGLQSFTRFSVRSCNLTGTLPASWANGLSGLATLNLAYNYITGTLPVEWQAMSLQILSIVGNGLSGSLPTGWASNGPASWQALQELHLDANKLRGTLPPSWGAQGSFPQIANVTLANNELSGSLPTQWGLDAGTFMTRFPRLVAMTLLPGNMGLCGSIPSGLKVLQKVGGSDTAPAMYLNNKPCPVSADTQIQSSGASVGPSQAGASPNLGAIIGGVVGGIVALAVITAAVLFFVLRQKRRNRAAGSSMGLKDQWHTMPSNEKVHEDHYDMGPMHDSDNMIPPKSTAPASIVPFAKAPSSMTYSSGSSVAAKSSGTSSKLPSSYSSQGSGYSEPAKEGDAQPETLPHMFSKDWELNLDALEIELDEEGREVELGKGAFGVVVKGRYRLSPVAVKRLINQTQEQQAQFLKEMAILRACRGSRYIVPFVGASLQPGNTILAMDFMENGNLWDQLPRTNKAGQHIFQWRFRGKKVAYEIALGLHCLHDLKVVHLDLKSSNVLIAADGSAKISDVGLAALMSQNYLSQMAPAGTWSWVAPEVILGGKVTNKADIYSFGVVIWEICTLERPAWRGNLREIKVPEEAPQEIADLVGKCTGDQEQRPSAQECAELLGSFLPLGVARKASGRTTSGDSGRPPTPKAPSGDAPKSSGSSPPASGKGAA